MCVFGVEGELVVDHAAWGTSGVDFICGLTMAGDDAVAGLSAWPYSWDVDLVDVDSCSASDVAVVDGELVGVSSAMRNGWGCLTPMMLGYDLVSACDCPGAMVAGGPPVGGETGLAGGVNYSYGPIVASSAADVAGGE